MVVSVILILAIIIQPWLKKKKTNNKGSVILRGIVEEVKTMATHHQATKCNEISSKAAWQSTAKKEGPLLFSQWKYALFKGLKKNFKNETMHAVKNWGVSFTYGLLCKWQNREGGISQFEIFTIAKIFGRVWSSFLLRKIKFYWLWKKFKNQFKRSMRDYYYPNF